MALQLEYARVVRTEQGLRRLAESIELATDAGRLYIHSSLTGIPKPRKMLTGDSVREYIGGLVTADETFSETLVKGLAELCKVKPTKVDAIRWLGNWFIENNPGQPRVAEA